MFGPNDYTSTNNAEHRGWDMYAFALSVCLVFHYAVVCVFILVCRTCTFGASLAAFDLLLTQRGYKVHKHRLAHLPRSLFLTLHQHTQLVYINKNGINAFFIRRDLLAADIDLFLPFESVFQYHEQIHGDARPENVRVYSLVCCLILFEFVPFPSL